MRNAATFENKTLGLGLSVDQQAIVSAERRLNRAKERRTEAERMLRHVQDDADIFGRAVDPNHLALLEHNVTENGKLVNALTAELDAAKRAPAERAAREKRGAELLNRSRTLDQRIESAISELEPLLFEAGTLADQITAEFADINGLGNAAMLPPFRGTQILGRLRLFGRDERGTFAERVKRYRKLTA